MLISDFHKKFDWVTGVGSDNVVHDASKSHAWMPDEEGFDAATFGRHTEARLNAAEDVQRLELDIVSQVKFLFVNRKHIAKLQMSAKAPIDRVHSLPTQCCHLQDLHCHGRRNVPNHKWKVKNLRCTPACPPHAQMPERTSSLTHTPTHVYPLESREDPSLHPPFLSRPILTAPFYLLRLNLQI